MQGGRERRLLRWLPAALSVVYLLACPFTKVEESFNMQAAHDFLTHVTDLPQYDHFEFPGVVPRTFIGAAALSAAATPAVAALRLLGPPLLLAQVAVRLVLLAATWHAFDRFRAQVFRIFGHHVERHLLLVTAIQFHFLFYSSRTLANTFAVIAMLHGYADWLGDCPRRAVFALVAAVVWFRCDMLILSGPVLLSMVASAAAPFTSVVKWGLSASAACLVATIMFDSVMWQRWLWPEGQVLWYNTGENKSSNWGTSPWHWYLTSALPRAYWAAVALVPIGAFSRVHPLNGMRLPLPPPLSPSMAPGVDRRTSRFFLPAAAFVALYSLLPHKELRFLLPAFPLLSLVAANGLTKLYFLSSSGVSKASRVVSKALWSTVMPIVYVLLALSFCMSLVAVAASSYNYPGGVAMQRLHAWHHAHEPVAAVDAPIRVHLDIPACETGVTRFLQQPSGWTYSKDESLTTDANVTDPSKFGDFHYLVSASRDFHTAHFEVMDTVDGFDRVDWRHATVATSPKLFVWRRRTEER